MRNALALFNSNIVSAKHSGGIYDYLVGSVNGPVSFDDLLRSQIVYSVSAFDKLIHDLVRIGMVETFQGLRPATAQYLNESISLKIHAELIAPSVIPPKNLIFEQAIFQKFKTDSYQFPEKVAGGLSYIWDEKQKWQKIANKMGITDSEARKTLTLIANRRNAIVHEADIAPFTNKKQNIQKQDSDEATAFLLLCGNEIANLVI